MVPSPRRKSFARGWSKRCIVASSVLIVLFIAAMQIFLLVHNLINASTEHGPALQLRGPSHRPGEEQADKLDPGTDELKEPSFARPHTRRNRWRVPTSTNSAARKAAERLMGPKPQPKDSSQEQEYEKLIESLRKSGRIGHQGHTPAGRQGTVQDLPQLHVSSKLAHAAEIGKHQASHGYQLTGGIKPKNKLGMEHLNMLKRMRGEDSNSNIWQ